VQKILNRVTITGADDSIAPEALGRLHSEYPFVEWGILVSASSHGAGRPRFPSYKWLRTFFGYCDGLDTLMPWSVHVCGAWVKDICIGDYSWRKEHRLVCELIDRADRMQLNFHACAHRVRLSAFTEGLKKNFWRQLILQSDGVNDALIRQIRDECDKVSVLHDRSGGAGKLPLSWPTLVKGMYNGYAGGLSPLNVAEELKKLEEVVGGETIWIDTETKVRSNNDKQFNIELVHEFLEEASPWVKGQ
jgi:hypothetical protein